MSAIPGARRNVLSIFAAKLVNAQPGDGGNGKPQRGKDEG
jgi:hypothetical protein